MEEYRDLKYHIEKLIHRGHHKRFPNKSRKPSPHPQGPMEKQIEVIIDEPALEGDSSSERKAYAWAVIEKSLRNEEGPEITLVWEAKYLEHDDVLVILVRMANVRVKRIMVDTGSFIDMLYFDAF